VLQAEEKPKMANRRQRLAAADLVERLRDGELTNFAFEEAWPETDPRADRAIRAIGEMLWNYYSDLEEHRLEGPFTVRQEDRALFDRCILFLRSEHPYEWPQDRFVEVGRDVGLLNRLSGGRLNRRHEERAHQLERELRSTGAWELWPFLRREDYEREISAQNVTER
jgi:hypothetical protein